MLSRAGDPTCRFRVICSYGSPHPRYRRENAVVWRAFLSDLCPVVGWEPCYPWMAVHQSPWTCNSDVMPSKAPVQLEPECKQTLRETSQQRLL